jgi:hypothetical protein
MVFEGRLQETSSNPRRASGFIKIARQRAVLLPLLCGLFIGLGATMAQAQTNDGNISPLSIEMDKNANLYPSSTSVADWVKDSLANTDPPSLVKSVATGVIPGTTGAVAKGHWNGIRIVDGIASGDQDIFLTGGKENDTSTWNVGPGSVGSSKYDITQAYLANNQTSLFFGMERRGNNGTTAFDFEFNQMAPNSATPLIPKRTVGDVLFTFEMNGSGSTGSATPHYYLWNGTAYAERSLPAGLFSSINTTTVPAAPWGYVDSKGDWTTGSIPVFSFAEASVNIASAFPNFDACNTSAFVQVRTRSSSTATSDLKDTTKIFEFKFAGPTAKATLDTNCSQQFTYSSAGSKDTDGGTNLTYAWDFKPPTGVTLNGTGLTGPDSGGTYHSTLANGTVNVVLPGGVTSAVIATRLTVIQGGTCTDSTAVQNVTVLGQLTAAITGKSENGSDLSVTLKGSAPTATSLQWQRKDSTGTWVNISGATSSSLTYSSFEADSTPTVKSFTIDGGTYQGKLWQVQLRLYAIRNANGDLCEAYSLPITVKKVTAVDP